MENNIKENSVLVLNRCWQAINIKSPTEAISMMYDDSATGLEIKGEDHMVPLKWEDWISLPYDENSSYIRTVNLQIKIPKIIVLCKFDRVPFKRPKFTTKNLWIRDGATCQYTGKKLTSKSGNIDHVIPKSRGGKTIWTNCVLSHREVNAIKANRTPEESGLNLIRKPFIPKEVPISKYIKNKHNIKEWDIFLKEFK